MTDTFRRSLTRALTAALASSLLCAASVSAQQAVASAAPAQPVAAGPQTNGFSVVLVLGDLQGGTTSDNVPVAVRKALTDMKDFLPYKSYHLLDAQWILGANKLWSRLRGPEDQEYMLYLSAVPSGARSLRVDFQLRDGDLDGGRGKGVPQKGGGEFKPGAGDLKPGVADLKARPSELRERRAKLEQELAELQSRLNERHPQVVEAKSRLEQLKKEMADMEGKVVRFRGAGEIITTSFSMDVGETVVVGTSKLRGDKALIALLTAVPRGR